MMKQLGKSLGTIIVIIILVYLVANGTFSRLFKRGSDVYDTVKASEIAQAGKEAIDRFFQAYSGVLLLSNPKNRFDATVVKQLRGDNPKKINFWENIPKDYLDAKGNLVDPWGHVYHLHINFKGGPKFKDPSGVEIFGTYFIWSDGPNGKNERGYKDDCRSWR